MLVIMKLHQTFTKGYTNLKKVALCVRQSNLASELTVLHKTFALEITDVKNVVVKNPKVIYLRKRSSKKFCFVGGKYKVTVLWALYKHLGRNQFFKRLVSILLLQWSSFSRFTLINDFNIAPTFTVFFLSIY